MRTRTIALVVALVVTSFGVVAVADAPTAEAACVITQTQRYGARNAQVRCIQQTLDRRGIDSGPIDGIFGSRTRAAVITYQRRAGLHVDGVVGPQTGRSLGIWSASAPAPARWACSPSRKVPDRATTVVDVRSSGSRATVRSGWTCV
jgi:peptidoglycan hydrolase-like protein with peptidoglycan-binding domain